MSGRTWAYTGAVLGSAVSVGANVAHSYVPPAGAPPGWAPQPGAVLGSVFWPLAVLVALEILARVDWPDGLQWLVVRWGGLAPVGGVAAIVSYRHLGALLSWYGEDRVTSTVGPLAVDGLMLIASSALLVVPATIPVVEDALVAEPERAASQAGPELAPATVEPAPAVAGPDPTPTEPETPPAEPAPAAPQRPRTGGRTAGKAAGKAAAPRASDEDLLARLDVAVTAGELAPDQVTKTAVRTRYGVGDTRAARIADGWHERHRRTAVAAVSGPSLKY